MNICVFASGTGSNFKTILSSVKSNYLNSTIPLLITNISNCAAAEIATANGIEISHISRKLFHDEPEKSYSLRFTKVLEDMKIDFIVLAGYMQKIPDDILNKYRERIINIHPALLPSFGGKGMYGINVHKAVISSGVRVSGITIHFVNEVYDEGKIIFQHCCEVCFDDDEFSLQKKIKDLEHKFYPVIIKKFEEGKVNIVNGKVKVI
ncbi:MAG: phosphoribosylglycinamide formyltransferase [Ignavibacteria bacterium]